MTEGMFTEVVGPAAPPPRFLRVSLRWLATIPHGQQPMRAYRQTIDRPYYDLYSLALSSSTTHRSSPSMSYCSVVSDLKIS